MRTNKELLQLLLDNIDKLGTGLCALAQRLNDEDIMSYNDWDKVNFYIYKNKPFYYRLRRSLWLVISLPEHMSYSFFWPIGQKEPRIKWLEQQIKRCK